MERICAGCGLIEEPGHVDRCVAWQSRFDVRAEVKLLRDGAQMPKRCSDGASGWDVFACLEPRSRTPGKFGLQVDDERAVCLSAGDWIAIPLGFAVALPPGWEMQLRPRSGLAINDGVMGYFGTIDSDYRGECCMLLFAAAAACDLTIRHGDRVGQAVFQRAPCVELHELDELTSTERGASGFGSTGR